MEFLAKYMVTIICGIVIVPIFIYYLWQSYRMEKCRKFIDKANKSDNSLDALNKSKLSSLKESYLKNIHVKTPNGDKTNIPANDCFSEQNVSKAYNWNLRMLDAASGILVGLGLLGTFLGLTLGIQNFDSSNTENIQNSIQSLLAGMGTAFYTSLGGMSFSIIYTFFEKRWKNKLARSLYFFTEQLDEKYYIDDISLMDVNQESLLMNLRDSILSAIENKFTYINASGDKIEIANAVREILKENEEQSKALKSFSTDLAIELNNGFETALSSQLQEKLIPLMENIDTTTKAVVEHIDMMSANVASPATDMIQNVVDELKNSMTAIMQEFKNNLSGDATSELEELAKSLGTTTQALADLPKSMEDMSITLKVTIDEVKNAISEITSTSAASNNTAMQQMQEQITFATTSISNAIVEVKEVMSSITQSSEQSSQEMISKLSIASEQMGQFLGNTLGQLSSSMKDSLQSITDDVTDKQSTLLALQEDTVGKTEKLLNTFNQGLERMEHMNSYITGTMDMFQKAQGEITGSTTHLRSITGDMKVATEIFHKTQSSYTDNIANIQLKNQESIDAVTELIKSSGEMSDDYVQKFEIIKQGLSVIFSQVQTGLNEYSRTVQASTQKYLDQYSTSLTDTTQELSNSISQMQDLVESIIETKNEIKK